VHSPKCSNGNRPIDKPGALRLLALLLGHEALPALPARDPGATLAAIATARAAASAPAPRLAFFDLETQRSAEEVGGWHNAHLMRVAVAVVYDTATSRYETFGEDHVAELLARLDDADLVVGFNVRRFDYAVLRGYTDRDPNELPTFDLLEDVHRRVGFRLPLGHLAQETLGLPKSADGLQSLAWWRAGERERVADYCRRDVEILRALFEHGVQHGHLRFRTRDGALVRLPARWSAAELVEAARAAARPGGRPSSYSDPRDRRRGRGVSSSKSMRAVTGSAAAMATPTRSPSS
jgi:DEAD/DEAH box helicase domain-containing protein